jgi:cell fate regulator YaaT (PSP1 superfamily)
VSQLSSNTCSKLGSYDWLEDLPDQNLSNIVEVRFKNTRKEFFRNVNNIDLQRNDVVAVESLSGHDTGIVSLKGTMAQLQAQRKIPNFIPEKLRIIYRLATENDIETWKEAKLLEVSTMLRARVMASGLGLEMKISDVEYQGDKKKATFYYIAESRVDFRELLRVLADTFKVRIEMKQIGLRQEAARVGGLGSCGRELCCSSWRTELPTIPSSVLQIQQLNPGMEKYLGQCGKLKCCLTYEIETYIEAKDEFPKELLEIELKHGIAIPTKIDILKRTVWYLQKIASVETHVELHLNQVKELLMMNKKGLKLEDLRKF